MGFQTSEIGDWAFSGFHSYYGLSVWFPDVIKHLQSDEYASRVKHFRNEEVSHFVFNFTLENQIHSNGEYINDRFRDFLISWLGWNKQMHVLKHVLIISCFSPLANDGWVCYFLMEIYFRSWFLITHEAWGEVDLHMPWWFLCEDAKPASLSSSKTDQKAPVNDTSFHSGIQRFSDTTHAAYCRGLVRDILSSLLPVLFLYRWKTLLWKRWALRG